MGSHLPETSHTVKKSPPGRGIKGVGSLNLALRFVLELAALAAFGLWGWHQVGEGDVWLSYVLAIGLPIIAATVWGVFNVPDDPSRSGVAPVVVPGVIRLAIELAFFALATWTLHDLNHTSLSWLLGTVVIIHYLVSYNRVIWLVKQ